MDRLFAYDLIYALAARDGREQALFGSCAPLAREAFARSVAGRGFPELWFELPLAGEPWFDLHVPTERAAVSPEMDFAAAATGGHPELFSWFARAHDVRQLILSWDVSAGSIERSAVMLLVNTHDAAVPCDFLQMAGGTEAAEAYRSFASRLPEGWFACYQGVFPDRPGSGVRVECIPDRNLQAAYAEDPTLLATHLHQLGFTALDDAMLARCQVLAQSAFPIEFQLDVLPGGEPGTTLGVSLRFNALPGSDQWPAFDAADDLMHVVEEWGLADERWHLLHDVGFSKRAKAGGPVLYCFPAFVKLRWRAAKPLDAKTYLMAGAQGGTWD